MSIINIEKYLKLINNDNWEKALKTQINLFDPIDKSELSDNKNVFHYACMRGETHLINNLISLKSNMIFLSDKDGNTGAHLLALNSWDNILLDVLNKEPSFLKLKNDNDQFIFNIVISRVLSLKKIINLMIDNKYIKYINYVRFDNRTFIYDIIDYINDDMQSKYIDILKLLNNTKIKFNIPKELPPIMYAIGKKYKNICLYLLDNIKTIDINIITSEQYTPLIGAIIKLQTDIAIKLISMKCNVNYGGPENKYVPLILCIKKNMFDIVEKILEISDVDFNKCDNILQTPIFYILKYINENKQSYNTNKNIKKILTIFVEKSNLAHLNSFNITPFDLLNKYGLLDDLKDIASSISESLVSTDNEKDNINIILPDVIESCGDFGLFNSDGVHCMIYLVYMLKKYNNLTLPIQCIVPEKQEWDMYNMKSIITDQKIELMENMLIFYSNIFYTVLPHIIFWATRTIYYKHPYITTYLKRAINSNHRYVILKITLIPNKSVLHANIVIYDKHNNIIIRFEPYGDWEFADSYFLDKKILKIFKKCISDDKHKSLKYIRPNEYLDKTKFQSASLGDISEYKNLGDPSGYCLAWCYWFMELKFLNPDINDKHLVEKALNDIIKNSNKHDTNPLLTHIRCYAKNLDNQKNIILTNLNITNNDLYKLSYTNDKILLIKKFINMYMIEHIVK